MLKKLFEESEKSKQAVDFLSYPKIYQKDRKGL